MFIKDKEQIELYNKIKVMNKKTNKNVRKNKKNMRGNRRIIKIGKGDYRLS